MPPSQDVTQWEGTPKPRRRYGVVVAILAAVFGAALLGRLASLDSGGTDELEVAAASESPTPTPRPRPSRSPRPSPSPSPTPVGSWAELQPEPLDTRYNATTLWTGTHLVVWGGHEDQWPQRNNLAVDGAMWNPETRRWTSIPPLPLPERQSSAVTWTGDAMFVWGGSDATGHRSDGALYEQSAGWSILPESPLSPRYGAAAARWGDEVLVVGGWDNLGVLDDAAAYNVETRRWRMLPPFPLKFAEGVRAIATPRGLVFWAQGFYGDTAAGTPMLYDRARNRWRRVGRGTPEHGGVTFSAIAAVGRDLYAVRPSPPFEVLRLRGGRGEWEPVQTLRENEAWAMQMVPAGRHLFLLTSDPALAGQRLDTRTMESVRLPPDSSMWSEITAFWTGRQLVVRGVTGVNNTAGGVPNPDGVQPRLMIWRPGR